MKLASYIARRYLFSRKSLNVINLISGISVAGVTIGTLALVVVLSAFNGIDSFVQNILSSFDADLKITIDQGKTFEVKNFPFDSLLVVPGVVDSRQVVEDMVLLRYENRQKYAVMKGVGADYGRFSGLDSSIIDGRFVLNEAHQHYAVVGQGVAYDLSVGLKFKDPIHIYYPRKQTGNFLNPASLLNHGYLFPSGIFSVQQDIDEKYILVPIDFARSLFNMEGQLTSVELKLRPDADIAAVKKRVAQILGPHFRLQDRYEQHKFLYRVMKSEKWSSFLILSFILIIASFNLLGTLTMILLDKKNDIFILRSMGAGPALIRRIFLLEGWLISLLGAMTGLFLGIILVWAQQHFELLKLPSGGSFAIPAYPVQLQAGDLMAVLGIVLLVGFLAAWYPVAMLQRKLDS